MQMGSVQTRWWGLAVMGDRFAPLYTVNTSMTLFGALTGSGQKNGAKSLSFVISTSQKIILKVANIILSVTTQSVEKGNPGCPLKCQRSILKILTFLRTKQSSKNRKTKEKTRRKKKKKIIKLKKKRSMENDLI